MAERERDVPVKIDKVMLHGEKIERKVDFCQCRSVEWWERCPAAEEDESVVVTGKEWR